MTKYLLNIQQLSVSLSNEITPSWSVLSRNTAQTAKNLKILDDISLCIKSGEVVGLVGQSGSGKTTLAMSILRLAPGYIHPHSTINFENENLVCLSEKELQKRVRGKGIGIIFQDARASLNPVRPIGKQVMDVLTWHKMAPLSEVEEVAQQLLIRVGIPADRFRDYPHQFSGGEAQRIAIAKAIACKPKLLLADEPTSALDLITQKKIINLIIELKDEFNMAILFVSHSIQLIASGLCDRIAVIHNGRIVEEGEAKAVFNKPVHEITKELKASILNTF